MIKRNTTPIIIVGMHRSGTSLLANLLKKLGLFIGNERGGETLFFLKLNMWILKNYGFRWDQPKCYKSFKNDDYQDTIVNYLNSIIESPNIINFLGIKEYVKYKSLKNIPYKWGWKDPRNVLTLPIWLKIFPNAKIIYIKRHGVDVANSLFTRSNKLFDKGKKRYHKLKYLNRFRLKKSGFVDSPKCLNFDVAFSIWEEYMEVYFNNISSFQNDIIELKYEDLLKNPYSVLKSVLTFCDISISDSKIYKEIKDINGDRAYSHKKNIHLKHFADENGDILGKFGY